jgi:hypothetical protein
MKKLIRGISDRVWRLGDQSWRDQFRIGDETSAFAP